MYKRIKLTAAVLEHLNSQRKLALELNRAVLAYCESVDDPASLLGEQLELYRRMRALVVDVPRCCGCGAVQTDEYVNLRFCAICSSD